MTIFVRILELICKGLEKVVGSVNMRVKEKGWKKIMGKNAYSHDCLLKKRALDLNFRSAFNIRSKKTITLENKLFQITKQITILSCSIKLIKKR